MAMTAKDAWLYAASWGSFMTSGDPGACMYGFDERFRVQSEQHRADCLEQIAAARADVESDPEGYDADELDQMALFVERLKSARLESDPAPLAGLDAFAAAYIEAMIWSDDAPDAEDGRAFEANALEDGNEGNFPSSATAEDIAQDTLAKIKADCDRFQATNAAALAQAYARPGYGDQSQAGHDFWLPRNRHGVGFWDRSALDADGLGETLTKAAHAFGEVDSYFGDDGRIHI